MLAATNELETTRVPCCPAELSIAVLVMMAQEAKRQGRYPEAEAFLNRAGKQAKMHFGPDTVSVATILWDLASIHQKQGRQIEADELCREVREILGIQRRLRNF